LKNILLRYEIFERFCLVNLENIFKRFRISRFFYFVSENIPKITKNIKNIMSAPRWRCGAIFFLAIFENAQIWSFPIKICFQIFDHVLIIKNKKKRLIQNKKCILTLNLTFFVKKFWKKKDRKKSLWITIKKRFPTNTFFKNTHFFQNHFTVPTRKKIKNIYFQSRLYSTWVNNWLRAKKSGRRKNIYIKARSLFYLPT